MKNQLSPFLKGTSIYLREVCLSDVNDNYCNWLNDPEVNQFLEVRHVPQSRDSITEFVQSTLDNPNVFFMAICLADNDIHIGNIKLGPINSVHHFADVSLFIGDKKSWRKGIATEAIRLLTKFAFDNLNLHKLTAGCYAENTGSAKAFEKVGFKREGMLKKHRFYKGKYTDQILLGFVNDKWKD